MTLKAFEPTKKLKFGKTDMNILAQTSSDLPHKKHGHALTGQTFNEGTHKIFAALGFQDYEFQIMDYFVVIIGCGVLIAVIIVACICFPPYKSQEDWEKIENERDERDAKEKKKKQKEEEEKKADEEGKEGME